MFGIEALAFWHWWVLAVALLILEVFTPTAFFMWIGIAAGIVGLLMLVIDMGWQLQFLLFAALSVLSVVMGRTWFKRNPIQSEQPNLNRRGQSLIGQVFTVEQAIVNGAGRVRVGDSTWKAVGEDAAMGEKVKVSGIRSGVLQVEKIV